MTDTSRAAEETSRSAEGAVQKRLQTLKWWPALAGAAFAGLAGYGTSNGQELAPALAASALIYLGSAALKRKGSAWPLFFLSLLIAGLGSAMLGLNTISVLIALGGVLLVYGIATGAAQPFSNLPLQALAMIAFCVAGVAALVIDATVGSYIVALGLFAHAGWDAYHHWVNRVVSRSMAEFCFVLDIMLGIIILVTVAY